MLINEAEILYSEFMHDYWYISFRMSDDYIKLDDNEYKELLSKMTTK